MAEEKTVKAKKTPTEEKVEIFIEPARANEEKNFFVGINGKNYLLPRGKTSLVPKNVYNEIMRARKAQARADEAAEHLRSMNK